MAVGAPTRTVTGLGVSSEGMRALWVTVVLVSSLAIEAHAKCAGEWVKVAPANEVELPPRPHLLVTLGGRFQSVDVGSELELVSGQRRVAVEVVNRFKGYSQVVALVRPVKPLAPARWALQLSKQAKQQLGRALGSWQVGKTVDTTAPRFMSAPAAGKTAWAEYGCGPGSSLEVTTAASDEPNAFVEAAVTIDGKVTSALFAPNERGDFDLGHGMCSGAFSFEPGTGVSVVLTPIDLSGNRGASSAPLSFVAPGPSRER